MKSLLIAIFTTLSFVSAAHATEFVGFDCSNSKVFNNLRLTASVRFGADGMTANLQSSEEANPVALIQTKSNIPNRHSFVFTPQGAHPFKNIDDGAILIVESNTAGFLSYRGKTVAVSCTVVVE